MSNAIIQADYDALDAIAARFGQQAEASTAIQGYVMRSYQALEDGGWEGRGFAAFSAEMQSEIFPTLQRLTQALEEARSVTLQASAIMRQAEEEAARVFQGGAAAGAGDGNGTSGVSNAAVSGAVAGVLGVPGFGATALGVRAGTAAIGWLVEEGKWSGGISLWDKELGRKGKFKPGISIGYHASDAFFGDEQAGQWQHGGFSGTHEAKWSAAGGGVGIGAKFDEDGLSVGLSGEAYAAKASVLGVVGDKDLGLTGEAEVEVLSVEGFVGIKDNNVGATVGVNVISVEGEVGTNIAGVNVGVKGEVGLKVELGFEAGADGFEVKLPFISFGISFGGAK